MARSPLAHSPRSISLQRSQQKGRHGLPVFHSRGFWHVGQFTCGMRGGSLLIFCQHHITLVQGVNLAVQMSEIAVIVNDIVCPGETVLP